MTAGPIRLEDVVPGYVDFGPIPAKADPFGGVYLGKGAVMTRLWTTHLFKTSADDMIVMPHLLSLGLNEPHVTRTLVSLTKPGDVFVDVGANSGYYSVLAGWRAYPGGKVWSLEPLPKLYAMMSDNMVINGFGHMAERRRVALSDRTGTADLRVFEGYEATSTIRDVSPDFIAQTEQQTGQPSHIIAVDVVRLDDVMRDVPEAHVIKIDAEGHEPAIIRGGREILARSKRVVIVMEFVPPIMARHDALDCLGVLRGLGFSIFRLHTDSSLTRYDDDAALLAVPFSDLLLVRV